MPRTNRLMIRNYADDLRLFPTWSKRLALVAAAAIYLLLPRFLTDYWAGVLVLGGITAIGAIGLNLLTGYTGQPSLGTAAFIGLGAFTAGYLGGAQAPKGYDLPLVVYVLIAIVLGGLAGFVIGLPALRLRGNYLAIVTLGVVYLALYLWQKWTTVTGGNAGSPMPVKANLYNIAGHQLDILHLTVFGKALTVNQGLLYLAWGLVGVVALLVTNIVRSRPGRALQAVRDRDVAAEVVGVSLFRYKVGAFVVSSAIGALAGVLYGMYLGFVTPNDQTLGLALSIQFLAIIVVGGIGTVYGSILGAVVVGALPAIIDRFADAIPFVTTDPGKSGISKGALSTAIYAVLIIVFLVLEPQGLAGIWRRIRAYFHSWPFSY